MMKTNRRQSGVRIPDVARSRARDAHLIICVRASGVASFRFGARIRCETRVVCRQRRCRKFVNFFLVVDDTRLERRTPCACDNSDDRPGFGEVK